MRWALLLLVLGCAGCPSAANPGVRGPGSGGGGDTGDVIAADDAGVKKPADEEREEAVGEKGADAPVVAESPAAPEATRVADIERSDTERRAAVAPRVTAARSSLDGGDLERAVAGALSALSIDAGNADAAEILAEAYYRKGWTSKAARILEVATAGAEGKRDARLWMLRGLVLERTGAPLSDVAAAYNRATVLKPNYARAWNNLGVVQLRQGQTGDAISALETATSIDAGSASALINLGSAYRRHAADGGLRRSNRDELLRKAERAYRAAIAVDEDALAAYLDLGVLYLDAQPFPGLADDARLQAALRYLREYKQRGGHASGADGAPIDVDEYLGAAQRQLDALGRSRKRGG